MPDPLNMPLEDAIRTQRAIRRIKPDEVDDALLLRLIELATKAPVGSNQQVWDFIVLKERSQKAAIGRLNRRGMAVYLGLGDLLGLTRKAGKVVDATRWQIAHFDEIPVVIVPCYKGRPPAFPYVATTTWFGSIYPAVQNLLLSARAAGIGANLITMPLWNMRAVRRILQLPRDVTPVALIPMGWPMGRYGPTTRRPVGEVVHVDRFGNQPFRETPAPPRRRSGLFGAVLGGLALGAVATYLYMARD